MTEFKSVALTNFNSVIVVLVFTANLYYRVCKNQFVIPETRGVSVYRNIAA